MSINFDKNKVTNEILGEILETTNKVWVIGVIGRNDSESILLK